jgi:hypothetical protein
MTTIVWVMMIYSHANRWHPTLEFTTEAKCVMAGAAIKNQMDNSKQYFENEFVLPKCVKIEK